MNSFKAFCALGLTSAAFALSSAAFAAFTPAELIDATRIAVADFTAANPEHADHFVGYKAWKSGEDARVKIYVTHDGANLEFDFLCHKHDDGTECHAQ